jgi:hypothetical protein
MLPYWPEIVAAVVIDVVVVVGVVDVVVVTAITYKI